MTDQTNYRLIDPVTECDWSKAETRWRGGTVQARWAQDGEAIVKNDGTNYVVKGTGSVAIVDANGVANYSVSPHLARAAYTMSDLPQDKTDTSVVTLTRKPEQVKVIEVTEPLSFHSVFPEDQGTIRRLEVGDLLERAMNAQEAAIRPIWKASIPERYISAEQAHADLKLFENAAGRQAG